MKKLILLISFITLLISCDNSAEKIEGIEIIVDVSTSKNLNLNDYADNIKVLKKDNEPIYLAGNLLKMIFTDSSYIVLGDKTINEYNNKNGEMTTSYSSLGRAENEFLFAVDIWHEGDSLLISDANGYKVLIFDNKGKFIDSKSIKEMKGKPFNSITPYKDGYFGFVNENEFAIYNANLEYIKDVVYDKIKTLPKQRWSRFNPVIINVDGEILYAEQSGYEIFSIDDLGNSSTKYSIDFLDKNMSKSIRSMDATEQTDFLNEHQVDCISGIYNIYESAKFLCFTYYDDNLSFAIYDKESGKTITYIVEKDDIYNTHPSYTTFNDDNLIICLNTEEYSAILDVKIEDLL